MNIKSLEVSNNRDNGVFQISAKKDGSDWEQVLQVAEKMAEDNMIDMVEMEEGQYIVLGWLKIINWEEVKEIYKDVKAA